MKRHFGKWLTAAALAVGCTVMTANAFADDAYRAKQAGMNEHVAKPLEIGRLLEVMHRWI